MAPQGRDGDARDRDSAGRARNARPRDEYGRPLPYGSEGVPTMPDDLRQQPEQGVVLAQELLDADRPFHAHEVFEALWKDSSDPSERELWQGLAQLAVGLTHQARGNAAGAETLVRRGRDRVAAAGASGLIDTAGVVAWADDWLAGRRNRPLRLVRPASLEP